LNQEPRKTETPDVLDKSAAATAAPPATVTRAESAVPRALQKYLTLDDFEATARRRIPKFLYGYISGGAETDAAVRDNRKAFDEYGFVPRVLNDVSGRDQTTTLFGKRYASPFGIPPMGSSALCAYRGDIVLTRAATETNVLDCTPSVRHANFCDRLSLRMTDDRQNGDQNVSDGVQIEGDQAC
jgi:hypothetical protein